MTGDTWSAGSRHHTQQQGQKNNRFNLAFHESLRLPRRSNGDTIDDTLTSSLTLIGQGGREAWRRLLRDGGTRGCGRIRSVVAEQHRSRLLLALARAVGKEEGFHFVRKEHAVEELHLVNSPIDQMYWSAS